ncbi:YlbF family regulator [Lactobacillus corticis]|uniref:UPF0342 protein LCB40_05240 n=1 Tax=Lactobacillus corticis TaxID=2201249 RepID=A0A916QG29_9LACO|nr:YlbF family regulator [Lactobacillus corticis]GFZ26644.1 hypothetical protein LCB40_05240 [Lactobacillus corticis]
MINIYDSANQLAADMTKTDEFSKVKEAIAAIKADATSSQLFKQMDELQAKIAQAQQSGQDLSKEDQEAYQKLNQSVTKDKNIVNLLQAESALYQLLQDVQKTYMKPLNDLYSEIR